MNGFKTVTAVSELEVGQEFHIVERGNLVGPFVVVALTGARTEDHIIARAAGSVIFEQYAPYTVHVAVEGGER